MLDLFVLILILLVLGLGVGLFIHHQNKHHPDDPEATAVEIPSGCCGSHAICERDTLLSASDDIVYFEDEELDQLKDRLPATFTEEEEEMLEDVFCTLQEADVAGWLRSLQLRHINLPYDLMEQALMVVAERRDRLAKTNASKETLGEIS